MTPPKIRIPAGLPFRFETGLGEMEIRKGSPAEGPDLLSYLEIATVASLGSEARAWRLGEDGNLQPGYGSIVASGYELVDLSNPGCEAYLRTILYDLIDAPGVEIVAQGVRTNEAIISQS